MTQHNVFAASRAADDGGEPVDLRMIFAILRRRIWVMGSVAAVVLILALIYSLVQPNLYTASSSVLLDRQKAQVTEVNSVLSDIPEDSASVDTEVQILRSPDQLRRVVDRLNLTEDPEFNGALAQSSIGAQLRGLLLDTSEAVGFDKTEMEERVASNLESMLSVDRRGLTYVIGISVTTRDPKKSALIANAVGEEYINRQIELKRNAAIEGRKFLESRLSGLGAEVQSQESRAQELRARAGLPQDGTNIESYDQQIIQDTARQAIELQSLAAEKRSQLSAALNARDNPASLPAVLESNVVRDLKSQRAIILSRVADVSSRYGPLHPETRKVQEEMRQIDAEIAREMGSIVASLSQEVRAAEQRLASANSILNQVRRQSVANSRTAAEVQQVDRQAVASRGVYEDFLKRSRETSETESLIKPDALIISRANAPNKPSAPNRLVLMIAGFAGAIGLGLLAVVVSELLDIKISSSLDIRRYMQLDRLVSVPKVRAPRGADTHASLIAENPLSSYAESFRDLADLVLQNKLKAADAGVLPAPAVVPLGGVETSAHVVEVTSSLPHEGKTTVACSLALTLAAANHSVLLIDADLRRPHVLSALNIQKGSELGSVADVIADSSLIDSVLIAYPDSQLSILALSEKGVGSEIFRSDDFAKLMASLRKRFDFIVIDTAPVLAISDGRYLSLLADEVLLVTRWRKTSRFAARAAAEALQLAEAPVTGVVLNAVDLKAQSLYSRDDSLAFYSSYKAYYAD